jgi:hypothetical protein
MSYRIEIRCDVQHQSSRPSETCESLRGGASVVPAGDASTVEGAKIKAMVDAERNGWVASEARICNKSVPVFQFGLQPTLRAGLVPALLLCRITELARAVE